MSKPTDSFILKYNYHKDGAKPNTKKEIFVFGSNTAGIHEQGFAKKAWLYYGARAGQGIGITGKCYAIPVKNSDQENLPLETIGTYVDRFKKTTRQFPEIGFFVTPIGVGTLAYSHAQIAPLFAGCEKNCNFPIQWKPFLEF